jgi:hypothetical protein
MKAIRNIIKGMNCNIFIKVKSFKVKTIVEGISLQRSKENHVSNKFNIFASI